MCPSVPRLITLLVALALEAPPLLAQTAKPQPRGLQSELMQGFGGGQIADAQLLGLPPDSKADVLTWELVHRLALVRQRSGAGLPEGRFDPKALDELATKHGVQDFARFRAELLDPGKALEDPAPAVYETLRRALVAENRQRATLALEQGRALFVQRVKGESSGLEQLDIDRLDSRLQEARLDLARALTSVRDSLDELLPRLGLAVGAPVLPDREILGAFRRVFDRVDSWATNPQRHLSDLPGYALSLPAAADLVVDDHPFAAWTLELPSRLEESLSSAVKRAQAHAGASARPTLAADVRRAGRRLIDAHIAYSLALRMFVLSTRQRDQAYERVIAPPLASAAQLNEMSGRFDNLLAEDAAAVAIRDRLVTLWVETKTAQLALGRLLGIVPAVDWPGYLESLAAVGRTPPDPRAPAPAPATPAPAPAPASKPGPPRS